MKRRRDIFDLISGNARIHALVDARKMAAGPLHEPSTSKTAKTPEASEEGTPKRKTIVFRGLGNARDMDALLRYWVDRVAICRGMASIMQR